MTGDPGTEPCGYVTTTPDGVIVTANRQFLTLTGYEQDALVGRTFAELLTAGGRIYHETHYAPMLQMHGRVDVVALDLVTATGGRVPILVSAALERDRDGKPLAIRAAVFDATDRRAYERELLLAKERAESAEARATALARMLQRSLIPPTAPNIPGLEIAAVYRPAGSGDEVGGDFYDVFEIADDHWVVVLGDVCGKGVNAAVVTALARYTLRAAAVRFPTLSEALAQLNRTLLAEDTDRFCTAVMLRLQRVGDTWTATVACAGHPQPVLHRTATPAEPLGRPGSLLGVLAAPVFHEVEIELLADDTIVLYTDGVTEGRRGSEFFGTDRLYDTVTAHAGSAAGVVDAVLERVMDFQSGAPRDDIAVVAVRLSEGERGRRHAP